MPSPIAHTAMGYAIYRLSTAKKPLAIQSPVGASSRLLFIALFLSQLPDLDFVPGFFLPGTFDQFHNTITNSIFVGVGAALLGGTAVWLRRRSGFWSWFWFVLICYETHVFMDYFTVGRGAMLFWPLTTQRFEPTFKLFYGLHRSDGWLSIRHIWTLITELGFAALIVFAVNTAVNKRKASIPVTECKPLDPKNFGNP